MSQEKEFFFKYPEKRDAVILLGAGASYPDGVPLQKDILPIILDGKNEEIESSEIGSAVVKFIRENFSVTNKKNYPQLEAIFGFLDYFLYQRESLNSFYSNSYIFTLKEHLIKLIHYVVNYKTNKPSHCYLEFWNQIEETNKNISLLTLNYDTLLEQAFNDLYQQNNYIDYCINFMNYEHIDQLSNYHFWVNPREPLPVKADKLPHLFKIIKIHGSLNWKYCNCCNQVMLTPWDRKIDLKKNKFLGYTYPDKKEYEFLCPIDHTEFQTLIMPPTFVKNLKQPVLSQLRNEASREIRAAKKIIIIGYSLSYADIHIKALFKKNLAPETEIIVVNPKMNSKVKQKFESLSNKIKFIKSPFEEFLNSDSLKNFL